MSDTTTPPDAVARRLPPPPLSLAPVLAALQPLSIGRRIGVLVACLLVPGIVATWSYAAALASQMEISEREREGVDVLVPALHLMVDVVAGREADMGPLADAVTANPELGLDETYDTLRKVVAQHSPASAKSRVRTAESLAEFITELGNTSNLILDPDLDSFYVIQPLVAHLPAALVAAAEAAAPVPTGRGVISSRAVQAGVLANAAIGIRANLQTATDSTAYPGLAMDVAPMLTAARTFGQLATTISADLGAAATMDNGPALAATDAAIGEAASGLAHLIDARVDTLTRSQLVTIIVAVIAFAAATWIGIAVLWRTRTDVVQLVGGVQALAMGDRREHQMPAGADEFGDIGRALASARSRLARADDELRDQSEERLRLLKLGVARQHLLERLLAIQRLISARKPLADVFERVVESAAEVLDGGLVGLVVVDPANPTRPALAATHGTHSEAEGRRLLLAGVAAIDSGTTDNTDGVLAVPFFIREAAGGALVAITSSDPEDDAGRDTLLQAFAQQVGLALGDARTAAEVIEARHDTLTGLPNRTLLLDLLAGRLAASEPDDIALLFIDLDRFKSVNDSLGHQAGDELLAAVAQRIRGCLRDGGAAARLGGDEFAVVVDEATSEAASAVAGRIIAVLREPFIVAGTSVAIDASVGIALGHGNCAADAAALLSDADIAMYRAKKSGGGHIAVFDPHMREESLDRLRMVSDLRVAMSHGQLHVEYQPVVDLGTGMVVGVEGLCRWTHPERGRVSPEVFIHVAEQIGLIDELGRWVLRQTLRQLAVWHRHHPLLRMNVNVSAHQLSAPGFPAVVATELLTAGVRPDRVTLELTETTLTNDPDNIPRQLAKLKELGVRIAVDDFGTGYSSLAYLRRLPVDDVKIDQAFIKVLGEDPKDLAVVSTILDLARSLQLRAVAEGIESPLQLDILRRLGCPLGQGYLLGRPMLPAQLEAFWAAGEANVLDLLPGASVS